MIVFALLSAILLVVAFVIAIPECLYAECQNIERHYGHCRGATLCAA